MQGALDPPGWAGAPSPALQLHSSRGKTPDHGVKHSNIASNRIQYSTVPVHTLLLSQWTVLVARTNSEGETNFQLSRLWETLMDWSKLDTSSGIPT